MCLAPRSPRQACLRLSLVVVLLTIPGAALAQQGDDVEAGVQGLLNVDLRLGPFFVQPEIGLRTGYESVTNGRREDGSTPLDVVGRPSGALRLVLPIRGRHELYARGRGEYAWYRDFDGLRGWDTTAAFGYLYDSERLRFELSDNFFWGRRGAFSAPLEEDVDLDPQLDIVERLRSTTNDIRARLELDLRSRLGIELSGSRKTSRFDEGEILDGVPVASRLDRDDWSGGAAVRFQVNPRMTWSTEYEYTKHHFVDPANVRNGWEDRSGLRIELEPHERFSAGVFAGVRRFRPLREDDAFTGFSGEGDLRIVAGGRTEIELHGERDPRLAFFEDNSYFMRQGGQFGLMFAISRRVRLGGDVEYYQHDYPVPVEIALQPGAAPVLTERSDELLTYTGRFEWAVNRTGRILLRAGEFRRRSNVDRFDIDGLIISGGYAFTY